MPKRILFIHGISKIGGAEQDLLRILTHLDRKRFEPVVVCPPDGPLPGELERLKVTVRLRRLPSWRKIKDLPGIIFAIRWMSRLIKDLGVDVIHVNDYWWAPPAYFASRIANVPCIVYIRQEIEPKKIRQYCLKRPDKLIAISNAIKNVVLKSRIDASHVRLIYSGIDIAGISPETEGKPIRERYHLKPQQPVIGTVANIFPRKGYEYLLPALVEIRKKIPNIHCLIVGEGDIRYVALLRKIALANEISDHVTFAGFQEDVLAYIAAMDVFVLPSIMEGFGIVLLEAMAMEKPIVATAVGGIKEVIEDRAHGLLVPPRDPKALSEKVLYFLDYPQEGQKLGRASRQRVLERFSIHQTVSQLENLYQEVIG